MDAAELEFSLSDSSVVFSLLSPFTDGQLLFKGYISPNYIVTFNVNEYCMQSCSVRAFRVMGK